MPAVTLDGLGDRPFATVAETAAILGVDPRSVRSAIRRGEIPSTRAGTSIRIPVAWAEGSGIRHRRGAR